MLVLNLGNWIEKSMYFCDIILAGGGMLGIESLELIRGVDMGDECMLNWTLGFVRVLSLCV